MKESFQQLEQYRITEGDWASKPGSRYGAFTIVHGVIMLLCIADAGQASGWEHVSVTVRVKRKIGKRVKEFQRTPDWSEMCVVKNLFWDEDEVVVQYHPAKRDYINNHENCLHLWKPVFGEIPTPPGILVGITEEGKNDPAQTRTPNAQGEARR